MPLIEQAIFTSAETRLTTDYRVVARSAGLREADARELAAWCPTHDAMLDPDAESFNFHPLPSGAFCVSRTTMANWDGACQGPQRSLTHCLIVPPSLLAQFANNPFALIRVALHDGVFANGDPDSSLLEPLSLSGGAAAIDVTLLAKLAETPGPGNMAALLGLARNSVSLAIAVPSPSELMDGLLNCLPSPCRAEYSFSTGLKFSPRRPFRLVALSNDPAEKLWVANHPNVSVFEASRDTPSCTMVLDGWAWLIERVLATGQIAFLSAQLSKRRFDLTSEDLPALGLQLLEELDAGKVCRDADRTVDAEPCNLAAPRSHMAHRRFEKSLEGTTAARTRHATPSANLPTQSPQILEQLECLDDLVYDAIRGQSLAMQQLRAAWPKFLAELSGDLVCESREQYLRYALSIWEDSHGDHGVRDPARAAQALDVLSLLFGDA
jgi:hypothetical protein